MSHQGDVGMKDLFFASPTMLAARHASMPPRGIGFLLLSTDEEGRNALLVPIGQDDPSTTSPTWLPYLIDSDAMSGSCLFSP